MIANKLFYLLFKNVLLKPRIIKSIRLSDLSSNFQQTETDHLSIILKFETEDSSTQTSSQGG